MVSTLTRPRDGKMIAGVCAGLADRIGWSRTTVRMLFILCVVLLGTGVLAYLVLWILMPQRDH